MSITPPSPIPRSAVALWELDAIGVRLKDRTVVLIYGGYDAQDRRVAEKRFDLSDTSTPTLATYLAACPAGMNFKRQSEQFGVTLDPELAGDVV